MKRYLPWIGFAMTIIALVLIILTSRTATDRLADVARNTLPAVLALVAGLLGAKIGANATMNAIERQAQIARESEARSHIRQERETRLDTLAQLVGKVTIHNMQSIRRLYEQKKLEAPTTLPKGTRVTASESDKEAANWDLSLSIADVVVVAERYGRIPSCVPVLSGLALSPIMEAWARKMYDMARNPKLDDGAFDRLTYAIADEIRLLRRTEERETLEDIQELPLMIEFARIRGRLTPTAEQPHI